MLISLQYFNQIILKLKSLAGLINEQVTNDNTILMILIKQSVME